jgi:hypothetical protein
MAQSAKRHPHRKGQLDFWALSPEFWIHATVLHLLGLDHEKLTFRHNGANRRLTDVHGQVIRGILA